MKPYPKDPNHQNHVIVIYDIAILNNYMHIKDFENLELFKAKNVGLVFIYYVSQAGIDNTY